MRMKENDEQNGIALSVTCVVAEAINSFFHFNQKKE
jgi:hypothetical protein